MATLVASGLLAEISANHPCGDDLEYDADFLALELAVFGKPDEKFGKTEKAATPPDWKAAEALSLGLMERSRDLRVAVHLSRALLHRRGIGGFADGLALIQGLLEQRWDHVHPQLDPDDSEPAIARVNALAALAERSGMLAEVRDTPLASSRIHGVLTLRRIEYAAGEVAPPAGVTETPSLSSLSAVVADAHDAAVNAHTSLLDALSSTQRIETVLTEHVGAASSIDLSSLVKVLQRAADFIGERIDDAASSADNAGQADAEAVVEVASPRTAAAPAPLLGEISDRQDVIRMLDKMCAFYERNEPSSPVPLLLARARRLVDKSFMEILQDIAPDGMGQARQVGGVENE